jgi:hypothetical protein
MDSVIIFLMDFGAHICMNVVQFIGEYSLSSQNTT